MAKKTRVTKKTGQSDYLYVEVRGFFHENGLLDVLSFDSIRLKASNDTSAYQLGAALMQDQQIADPEQYNQVTGEPLEGMHSSADLLNDYVVKL